MAILKDLIDEIKELEALNGKTIDITNKIDIERLKEEISEKILEKIRRNITY